MGILFLKLMAINAFFCVFLVSYAHATILLQTGWENTSTGSCSEVSHSSCSDYWRCIDADDSSSCTSAPIRDYTGVDQPYFEGVNNVLQDVQSTLVHSGDQAYRMRLQNPTAAQDGHVGAFLSDASLNDDFYVSIWVYLAESGQAGAQNDWDFQEGYYRNKGLKMEDGGSVAINPYGGVTFQNKNGDATDGYGGQNASYPYNSMDTTMTTQFSSRYGANAGAIMILNWAANADNNSGNCGKGDADAIGMNTPRSDEANTIGIPFETDYYWPNCSTFNGLTRGVWWQIVWHHKIHATDGEIDVWVREGDDGVLTKIIELNKNTWDGTRYEVSAYRTECEGVGAESSVQMQLFSYWNASTKDMTMILDDYIVATTFEEVEAYGCSGGDTTPPTVSSASIGTDGVTVTINFDETVVTAGYDSGDLWIGCTGMDGGSGLISPNGSGATWIFTSFFTIAENDTCLLHYIGSTDDIEDSAGNDLEIFSDQAITNNSAQSQLNTSVSGTSVDASME
jgi:hypothetical protein